MSRYRYRGYGMPRGDYEVTERTVNGATYRAIKLTATGRILSHDDVKRQMEKGINMVSRWIPRLIRVMPTGIDKDILEYYWKEIDDYADRLEILAARIREEVAKHSVVRTKQERIKALRNIAGRTSEEAESFLAKADELEAEL